MKFVPNAISRRVADQALLGRKHSPTILFGVGIASMVGSTVLACRATLKLEEVLDGVKTEKNTAHQVNELVNDEAYTGEQTYTEAEMRHDISVIVTRGAFQVAKLYAPSIILGGVGVACLTKSHTILKNRNAALTAAYVAIDNAFRIYRERVVDRYGEDVDRELRYGSEDVEIIDEETGRVLEATTVAPGKPSGYARWFDEQNANWSRPEHDEYNWVFLRTQQNWANDMLRARGHLFLNEVYSMLGMAHTSAGAVVGWLYKRDNEMGDNYVDFGCWDADSGRPLNFFNGREGAILLDFNVDGPIWQLIDELRESQ
jgi:uncharacterized protein DUF6353